MDAYAQPNPPNPILAVTHPDPYPYYAELVARRPLYRDGTLGLWIAASAEAVTAVLSSDLCRVRPPAEPVPGALLGSPAAEVFRRLVRMNDGPGHRSVKPAVSATLAPVGLARAAEQSERWARRLSDELGPAANLGRLSDFAFKLPVYVVASLLGLPPDSLPQIALWVNDFVSCLAPASRPDQVERSQAAAGHLLAAFRERLAAPPSRPAEGLLFTLAREAERAGCEDPDVVIANGIGFLSQSYAATAGLLGNTLVTLASRRDLDEQLNANPGLLQPLLQEVLRCDPPIQNTRRFVARSGLVAGQAMEAGEAILVVLAAANRDPAANPDPGRFDLFRPGRRLFTFGAGAHACPGEALAVTIAQAGIERLRLSGLALDHLDKTVTYRASANARIPLWTTEASADPH